MAEILHFPLRPASGPRALITASGQGFEVEVSPSRPGDDLTAWFETYETAEAYAFGLQKTLGLAIVDGAPERAA